jgi:hypothetical protein
MDLLRWLEKWYKEQCDEVWEHFYGVSITSIDNPGWSVKIDLTDTSLSHKSFNKVIVRNSDEDWVTCFIENGVFQGAGDPNKLNVILRYFKNFVLSK